MTAPVLELRLPPRWEALSTVWEPCRRAFTGAGIGDDDVYSLCMVTQELLENAVKYGAYEGESDGVDLALRITDDDVTIEVRNPVGVDTAGLRKFDQAIQWIRGFQDPSEAYVEKMKSVSGHRYHDGKSGLGLTRMAYEGRCVVDFYVDAANTLAVSAVYRRGDEGAR